MSTLSTPPGGDTCMIRIQVSNAFFERLLSAEVWSSADWKVFVWTCKQELDPPPQFDYLRDAGLIKEHICTRMSQARITRDNCPAELVSWHLFGCAVYRY